MIDNKKYTVGWICAVTTEFVAAQAFLDEEHDAEELEVSTNDNNSYALGKIGLHHVVIAAMPDGEYGNTSAAMVGRDLVHSFPNVRVGLMVGIAGGAPSPRRDIRLGDVVVSRTDGARGIGGVFCYDFGRSIQNQSFQETAFLNQPPVLLRTSVTNIRALYERKGHQLEKAVEEALKSIRQRTKYSRPPADSDRLYKSNVVHPPDDTDYGPDDIACRCGTLCGSDPDLLVPRTKRTEEQDDPAIHYGVIASGNQLMKDAHVRDLLIEEKDVVCFEMEAAGLMNHFPCLVIRGICDYSDSHKNKEWQGFAAMMAAAYAKDLLRKIPQQKVEQEKRLVEVLGQSAQEINDKLAAVQTTISEARQDGKDQYEAKETADILEWLSSQIAWHPQTDFFRRRQEGTGQWLLDSPQYQNWIQTEGQTLFCPGLPGAGKTILTSIVVNDLSTRFKGNQNIGIAFLYCQFAQKGKQTYHDLLASILKQLSQGQHPLPESVRRMHEKHKNKGMPTSAEISSVLRAVTHLYSRTFIAIDALDECEESDSSRTKLLSEVFALQADSSINIFATSRFHKDTEVYFSEALKLKVGAHPEDVRRFIGSQVHRLPSFVARDQTVQEEIQNRLAEVSDGIFLLAQIHLKALSGAVTIKDIRTTLAGFVLHSVVGERVYDIAYDDAMRRIEENQAKGRWILVKKVLSWITCARRPLMAVELQHALAVEVGMSHLDEDNMARVDDFVSFAAGLVTIDKSSGIIRLVHHTTEEYFQRTMMRWFPDADSEITDICTTYLLFDNFKGGPCRPKPGDGLFHYVDFNKRLLLNPFYGYAAWNWGHHARAAHSVRPIVLRFLETEGQLQSQVQVLMCTRSTISQYRPYYPSGVTSLHMAAFFGLIQPGKRYLKTISGPDPRDSFGQTPLSLAAQNGFEAMVKLLLSTGMVNVNNIDQENNTPLSLAVRGGHTETVMTLLETNVIDVNMKDYEGATPLLRAAELGHEAITRLLLDTGKYNINARDNFDQSVLLRTIMSGHEAIVALLLNTGKVDINATKDENRITPLMEAVQRGHEEIVKKLLAKEGIELELRNWFGQTAFSFAAENGYEAIIRMLLETGKIDVDSRDDCNKTPLSHALREGERRIALLLLSTGKVDVTAEDEDGCSPLAIAAASHDEQLMQQLLDAAQDADLNSRSRNGTSPISRALWVGSDRMIRFLLASGRVKDVDAIVPVAKLFRKKFSEAEPPFRGRREWLDKGEILRQFVAGARRKALGVDHDKTLEAMIRLDDLHDHRHCDIDWLSDSSDSWTDEE